MKTSFVLENLDTCETQVISTSFQFTGDLIKDSDNFGSMVSFNFNLWSDDEMTNLLATSEV